MDSKVIYTEEIDDLDDAVEEILEKLGDFEFKSNTLGILYAEEEADYLELYRLLSKEWDFPIIGCTAMSMITEEDGFCNSGISVMLLTADDCQFAAGITGALSGDNYMDEIGNTYKSLADRLGNEEKLVISFGVLVTEYDDVAGDDLVHAIDAVGKKVPIFGGLASDSFNFTGNRVFFNDTMVQNGLVMSLVSGNIRPKCISVNSINSRANFSYEITESKSNRVFRLGNGTFIDALTKAGVAIDKSDVVADYILSPFVVTVRQPDGECIEVARNLSVLDHEKGSGTFLGAMPEGSNLGIGIIDRDDVQKSVTMAFESISKMLDEPDYEYKTILATTCAARFLALASNIKAESDVCGSMKPAGCSFLGLYAYGEFCPVKGKDTGEDYNMFHNFTFTILAI